MGRVPRRYVHEADAPSTKIRLVNALHTTRLSTYAHVPIISEPDTDGKVAI